MLDLRGVFTGAVIRTIAGIRDAGEAIAAYVGADDKSEAVEVADDKSDVWVKVIDERGGGRQLIGRLFIPGNILFSKPKDGQSTTVLRPADTAAPGAYLALHGDGGEADTIPGWWGDDDAGLFFAKKVHVESKQGAVEVKAGGGDVDLLATGLVNVNGTTYSLPKWDLAAAALRGFFTTVGNLTPNPPATLAQALADLGTIISAANSLAAAFSANDNYRSDKAQNG